MIVEAKRIQEGDLELLMKWRMQPEITKNMYTNPVIDMEKQKKWFHKINQSDSCKYWIINVDGVPIGNLNITGIDKVNNRCNWAYYIGDYSFQGKGLGRIIECNIYDYVFNELKLNKLCCEVFSFNEKVVEIHKKFGSLIEGELKQHILKNGEYLDVVLMGITKSRWEKIKGEYNYIKMEVEN